MVYGVFSTAIIYQRHSLQLGHLLQPVQARDQCESAPEVCMPSISCKWDPALKALHNLVAVTYVYSQDHRAGMVSPPYICALIHACPEETSLGMHEEYGSGEDFVAGHSHPHW